MKFIHLKMNLILKKSVSALRRISVNYLHLALVSMENEIIWKFPE